MRNYINSHLKQPWVPLKHMCTGPDHLVVEASWFGPFPRIEVFYDLTNYMEHLSEWHHATAGSDENIIKLLEEYTE